jgi:hypothetical protein
MGKRKKIRRWAMGYRLWEKEKRIGDGRWAMGYGQKKKDEKWRWAIEK